MIASLNMNGLRSHLYKVQLLMRELGIQILPLNESKLDPGYPKEITSVAGYQQERLDRTSNGNGVSIYVWDSIKIKRRLDVPTHNLEFIYFSRLVPDLPVGSKKFLLFWKESTIL